MSTPENIKPIKRSIELAPLSREHHDGLLLSWKIGVGFEKNIPIERIASYIVFFFKNNLENHFSKEEQYIFPLLAPKNELRLKAELQHKDIRKIIQKIENKNEPQKELLQEFSEALRDHIRYEERTLFNAIEETVDVKTLSTVMNELEDHVDCDLGWEDHFWSK